MRGLSLNVGARLAVAVGMDLWIAGTFLVCWIAPEMMGDRAVHRMVFVMLLEFLVVHSTGFFGAIANRDDTRRVRGLLFGLLMLLYSVFALAFSAMYGSLWPFLAFLVLTISKWPAVVMRPPDEDAQFTRMAAWAGMTAIYLSGAFLTVLAPVPPLGLTPEIIALQDFGVGGIWPEEPYRPLAFGVFHFTGLAALALFLELFALRRPPGDRAKNGTVCGVR